MANIKFSQFTEKTTLGTVDFLVGYTGAENVQISPTNLLSTFVSGSGTNGQVAYFDPSNNLAGENDFFWDYTNNRLGIGTNSPSVDLEIGTSGSADTEFLMQSDQAGKYFKISSAGNYTELKTAGNQNLFLNSSGSGGYITFFAGDSERMRIFYNGNVGIGTTSPGSKLQVNGTFANTGIAQIGSTGANVYLTSSSAGSVGIGTSSPTDKLDIAGAVRFTSNITFDSAKAGRIYKAANHGLAIQGVTGTENDLAIFSPTGSLRIVVPTGTNNLVLNRDTGNVGIGATSSNTFGGASKLFVDIGTGQGSIRLQNGNTDGVYFRRHTSGGSYQLQTYSSTSNTGVLSLQPFGGNVGIGTTSPRTKLEIGGSGSLGAVTNKVISATFDGGYSITNSLQYNVNAFIGTTIGSTTDIFSSTGGETDKNFYTGLISDNSYFNSSRYSIVQGGAERLTIARGGNVGIGTTSPDVKFEVVEASPTNGIVADFVNSTNTGGTTAAIKLSNADSDVCDVVLGANRVGGDFGSDFFISLSDSVDGSNQERLRITEDGNVGIGTSSPTEKLEVAGNASFTGDVTLDDNSGASPSLYLKNGNNNFWRLFCGSSENLTFRLGTVTKLEIDSSGNATFEGSVKAPYFTTDGGRSFKMDSVAFVGGYSNGADANAANDLGSTTNQWRDLYLSGDITSSAGGATFAGDVTIGSTGAASDKILNILTGGSDSTIKLMEAGTVYGFSQVYSGANNQFYIKRHSNDATGSAVITLNRDDNDATFAGSISAGGGTPQGASGSILKLSTSSGNTRVSVTSEATSILDFGNQADFDNGGILYDNVNKLMTFKTNANTRLTIDSSGNVGIGSTSPTSKLTVAVGDIETSGIGYGIILKSPDGTRYKVTVANGGTLSVSAV